MDHTDTTSPQVAGGADPRDPGNLIPTWLAVLVLVLLLAVVGVGGYVIRGVVGGDSRPLSPREAEIESWRAKTRQSPTDSSAHLGLGFAYQNAGRYDRALTEYAIVLKSDPNDTAALYNRGVVYLKVDAGRRAEESFWSVLRVQPDHVLAATALGEYYTGKKQYKSALTALRTAADAHPEMADLQYLMGLSYEKLGRTSLAIKRYQLALKYAPDMQRAISGLDRLDVSQ